MPSHDEDAWKSARHADLISLYNIQEDMPHTSSWGPQMFSYKRTGSVFQAELILTDEFVVAVMALDKITQHKMVKGFEAHKEFHKAKRPLSASPHLLDLFRSID